MNELQRYQIYLDPVDVSLVDQTAKLIGISRSQIVREAVKSIAQRYSKVLVLISQQKQKPKWVLDQLVGAVDTGKETLLYVSENIDSDYLED